MPQKKTAWKSYDGKVQYLEDMDPQHLFNIWYYFLLVKEDREKRSMIARVCQERGISMVGAQYKPSIDFKDEITALERSGALKWIVQGPTIEGTIRHNNSICGRLERANPNWNSSSQVYHKDNTYDLKKIKLKEAGQLYWSMVFFDPREYYLDLLIEKYPEIGTTGDWFEIGLMDRHIDRLQTNGDIRWSGARGANSNYCTGRVSYNGVNIGWVIYGGDRTLVRNTVVSILKQSVTFHFVPNELPSEKEVLFDVETSNGKGEPMITIFTTDGSNGTPASERTTIFSNGSVKVGTPGKVYGDLIKDISDAQKLSKSEFLAARSGLYQARIDERFKDRPMLAGLVKDLESTTGVDFNKLADEMLAERMKGKFENTVPGIGSYKTITIDDFRSQEGIDWLQLRDTFLSSAKGLTDYPGKATVAVEPIPKQYTDITYGQAIHKVYEEWIQELKDLKKPSKLLIGKLLKVI